MANEPNLKTISQTTGEFIDDDSTEPGFQVNMDDDGAQAFIDKIKGTSGGSTAPAESGATEPAATETQPVPETTAVTSEPVTTRTAATRTTTARKGK